MAQNKRRCTLCDRGRVRAFLSLIYSNVIALWPAAFFWVPFGGGHMFSSALSVLRLIIFEKGQLHQW